MNLSESNINLAVNYCLGDTKSFDEKDEDFKNLFLYYLNDKNSSSIREVVTARVAGCDWLTEKHGLDAVDKVTGKSKEVKPRLWNEDTPSTGGGNFNDMTIERLEEFIKEDFGVICSIFGRNRLMYVVEFPITVISEHLREKILKTKVGKRVSPSFAYTNFMNSDKVKLHYFNETLMLQYGCVSDKHFKFIKSLENERNLIKFFE